MYFPYVRGRQYELLAFRDLIENNLLSSKILPVVEPVKLSATLSKTMDSFISNGRNLGIVCNPAVGSFISDMNDTDKDTNRQKFLELLDDNYIIKSHIMKPNSIKIINNWNKSKFLTNGDWLIINNDRDCVDTYNSIFSVESPKYVLLPDELRRKIRKQRVLFENKFEKCPRNSDYQHKDDEFFSEDHLYYNDDGFIGFGDYSIVGDDYLESGFAPYAVAIHIVYFDKDNTLRIHHFVSDSNDDYQNPAKKFYEAVHKLSTWLDEVKVHPTYGLNAFIEHYKNQTYPGLGSVKKLSLMHHMELIGMYLDGVL